MTKKKKNVKKSFINNKDKEFLEEQYIRLGKTAEQISEEFNYTLCSIYKRLKDFNLIKNMSEIKTNNKNGMWKGNDAGIDAIHIWVKTRKSKPQFCECCNNKRPFDLANISGEYKRDINDYEWLCRKCHMHKDGRINNLINNKFAKCYKCNKDIDLIEENYICLNSYNKGRIIESIKFHLIPNCWGEYNTERVHEQVLTYASAGNKLLQQAGITI